MTELSVPELQRSQTPSEDLKNKENPVTENILLHSSFETLPLKVLRTSYFQYELAPGDLIKGTFLFQLANQKWSAEDFSDLEGSSETPPDSANFPDPRNQKTKMCHRPDWIWELGRQSSFIRKPGNLLGKGGKQINISSASSYRFSSTELFQVRKTGFVFERHLCLFPSRQCYTEFSQKESWRTHSLSFLGRACSARAKWAFTRAFFWGWCWRLGICKVGFPFLETSFVTSLKNLLLLVDISPDTSWGSTHKQEDGKLWGKGSRHQWLVSKWRSPKRRNFSLMSTILYFTFSCCTGVCPVLVSSQCMGFIWIYFDFCSIDSCNQTTNTAIDGCEHIYIHIQMSCFIDKSQLMWFLLP